MVFVWRGFGIMVPIVFAICAWITSYWFEDLRLGNSVFVGWSMFWASIPLTLVGLGTLMKPEPDENGKVEVTGPNDFFWIPIIIWGLVFLGTSIYLINKNPNPEYDNGLSFEYEAPEEEQIQLNLNIYTTKDDTISVQILDENSDELYLDEVIPPGYIRYQMFYGNDYQIVMNGTSGPIHLPESKNITDRIKYYENWLVMGDGVDLILVNVSQACRSDINKTELEEIEWSDFVYRRFEGKNLIEIKLTSSIEEDIFTVYRPGIDLPLEIGENEKIYALIPIPSTKKTSEEYLDKMIIDLCY